MTEYHFNIFIMGYKHISALTAKEIYEGSIRASEAPVNLSSVSTDRYSHCYFVEADTTNTDIRDRLIFTLRVNFLPARPVYIDIRNLRELILSMTSNITHYEALALKSDILDLLRHYEKIS